MSSSHAEPGKDSFLHPFHQQGLLVFKMIITQKMQDAMDQKMRKMIQDGFVPLASLGGQALKAHDDVAKQHRAGRRQCIRLAPIEIQGGEGQHIGRLITITIAGIEDADLSVSCEENADLALSYPRCRCRTLKGCAYDAGATLLEIVDGRPPIRGGHGQNDPIWSVAVHLFRNSGFRGGWAALSVIALTAVCGAGAAIHPGSIGADDTGYQGMPNDVLLGEMDHADALQIVELGHGIIKP